MSKEYYQKNKEKILNKTKEYQLKNKEKILKYAKEYRNKNRFILNKKIKDYNNKNRDMLNFKKREKNKQDRLQIMTILGAKCNNCGYNENILGLEIDHINGIVSEVGKKIHRGNRIRDYQWYIKHNKEKIKDDLQILCGTCHRIKTYNDKFKY